MGIWWVLSVLHGVYVWVRVVYGWIDEGGAWWVLVDGGGYEL